MNDSESSWINIADIMSALMMIFMFIAIAFLYQLLNEKQIYKVNLNEALHQEFDKDLTQWKAIITDDNIIRFDSPFGVGSDELPENFKSILEDFFPRYINVLSNTKFINEIEEIRVEGHTSKGWGSEKDEDNIYLLNMRLSQNRASNVLEYCYGLNAYSVFSSKKWLQKRLRANGMSYSNLLYKRNTQEIDSSRSRRVEFKVLTRDIEDKNT
jgi:outer membrane protein OmpA-like peptidoglycan-associated protein